MHEVPFLLRIFRLNIAIFQIHKVGHNLEDNDGNCENCHRQHMVFQLKPRKREQRFLLTLFAVGVKFSESASFLLLILKTQFIFNIEFLLLN